MYKIFITCTYPEWNAIYMIFLIFGNFRFRIIGDWDKMADQHALKQQFGYQQNSNLVLQVDRGLVDRWVWLDFDEHLNHLFRRAKGEATGEVKSLAGRLTGTKMGDRAVRTGTKEKEELEERKKKKVRDEDKEGFQIDSDYKAP